MKSVQLSYTLTSLIISAVQKWLILTIHIGLIGRGFILGLVGLGNGLGLQRLPTLFAAPPATASKSSSDNSSPALAGASALPPMALAEYGLASSLPGGGSESFVLRHGLSFGILRTKDPSR